MPYMPYIVLTERSALEGSGVFGAGTVDSPLLLHGQRLRLTIEYDIARVTVYRQRPRPYWFDGHEGISLIAVYVPVMSCQHIYGSIFNESHAQVQPLVYGLHSGDDER